LFAAALSVYNLNLQRMPRRHRGGEPAALLDLDGWVARSGSFLSYVAEHSPAQTPGFYLKEGRAYSGYPIALPLLLTPLYGPVVLLVRARNGYRTDRAHGGGLGETSGILCRCPLGGAVLSAGMPAHKRKQVVLLSVAYAFATETGRSPARRCGSTAAGSWRDSGLYGLVWAWQEPENRAALLTAGLGAGWPRLSGYERSLLCQRPGVAPGVKRRAAELARFSIAPFLLGSATLVYNLRVFGRATGGMARISMSSVGWACRPAGEPQPGSVGLYAAGLCSLLGAWFGCGAGRAAMHRSGWFRRCSVSRWRWVRQVAHLVGRTLLWTKAAHGCGPCWSC